MTNRSPLCLAPLTFSELSPIQFLDLAIEAGFSTVSMRPNPFAGSNAPSLLDDPNLRRMTVNRVSQTAVDVQECESFPLTSDFKLQKYAPLLDIVAELGGKKLVCPCQDPVTARAGDNLASLCDMAASYDLEVNVEFIPAFCTSSLEDALMLTAAADHKAGIIVDILHFFRSGSSLETLTMAAPQVRVVHLCDVFPGPCPNSPEGLALEMRTSRCAPGLGCADISSILLKLPMDVLFSIEVPDKKLQRIQSPIQRALSYKSAAEKQLAKVGRAI